MTGEITIYLSNGESNCWFTLTNDEWYYVFFLRTTSYGIRWVKAEVQGLNGVLLLPDNWNSSFYSLNNINNGNASYTSNQISQQEWISIFEVNGAVFMPAVGYRSENSRIYNIGTYGYYWSSTVYDIDSAYRLWFGDSSSGTSTPNRRALGSSVRLVCSAE